LFSINKILRAAVAVVLVLAGQSFAATYTSTQAGNWDTDATWGGGGHPSVAGDVVIIGHAVSYNAGASAVAWGNVTVNSGGMIAFPTTANSTMLFGATSVLTVNSGGELRTGTSGAVGRVGAAYTVTIGFDTGSSIRSVMVINDGGAINLMGAEIERYAYLKSDWTSGQTLYVEGDYTAKWAVDQKFYIHQNTTWVADGHKTQGWIYTIANVGAYDSGNNRTPITISETAPGVTYAAVYSNHRSKLVMVSRNVILRDNSATWGMYDYGSFTERLQLDLNQTDANALVTFDNCSFVGWERISDNGYLLKLNACAVVNCGYGVYYGSYHDVDADFISCYRAIWYMTGGKYTGVIGNCSTGLASCAGLKANCDIIGCSNSIGGSAFVGTIFGDVIGCSSSLDPQALCITGNIDIPQVVTPSGKDISVVMEGCSIGGAAVIPYRVRANSGVILPLVPGDTDWQTPESGNSWVLQSVPNNYCTYATKAHQLILSPLRPMAAYAKAQSTTLTFKVWPVGWATALNQSSLVLELRYLDTVSGVTRTTVLNTSQTYANGAWRECSVTFTPSQEGVVYFNLYLRRYESGAYVLIDPKWEVR
jgi:hypothetical protein